MVIKEEIPNVIDILEKAKKAIEENDVILLKDLGNRTIHTASTAQDTDSILLAVIMYTLSKLIERPEHKDKAIKNFCSVCSISFDKAIENLKKGKQKEFVASLERIQQSILRLSPQIRDYVKDVMYKAKINKASKIYEHGISMEKTAKLLGISMWELASYTGYKNISEEERELSETEQVKVRIKTALEMFG